MHVPRSNSQNPVFENGERMTRDEFHSLYEQMGDSVKAELIDGAVYVCVPSGLSHGVSDAALTALITVYSAKTPGVQAASNTTVFLTERDEVQPDVFLRIAPNHGGQSQDIPNDYVEGAPELVAEIAQCSRAIDLGIKRERYLKAGVVEYMVLCRKPDEFHWFDLRLGVKLAVKDGVIRSQIFPGLWIHVSSLLEGNLSKALDVLDQGLTSPEHERFVGELKR